MKFPALTGNRSEHRVFSEPAHVSNNVQTKAMSLAAIAARTQSESAEIARIIQALMQEVKRDPHLTQVGIWRDPANRPPDGLKPPFPDAAMIARMERCAAVVVRIDPRNDGLMRIDDTLMADILGRH